MPLNISGIYKRENMKKTIYVIVICVLMIMPTACSKQDNNKSEGKESYNNETDKENHPKEEDKTLWERSDVDFDEKMDYIYDALKEMDVVDIRNLDKDYSYEEAINDGDYMYRFLMEENKDSLDAFVDNIDNNEDAFLRAISPIITNGSFDVKPADLVSSILVITDYYYSSKDGTVYIVYDPSRYIDGGEDISLHKYEKVDQQKTLNGTFLVFYNGTYIYTDDDFIQGDDWDIIRISD